jgi:dolichol-phosphate mannosyltransferase
MKPIACIILPTYNEALNIRTAIAGIFNQENKIKTHELHVLVVDDNSPDGTQKIVKELQKSNDKLHILVGDKKGLGKAYKRGMRYAVKELKPDLIFEMDADGQHDPNCIPVFISLANQGFTLVIGSRFAQGGETPDFSFWRKTISIVGNWMIRVLGGIPRIRDCTSGYRCIKANLIEKCNLRFLSTRGYSFQSSLLCELMRNGANAIEVPIVFPDRTAGESKLTFRDQIEFLINIVKIRFRQSEEFIKFCFVGASGVIVNLGIYIILTRLFSLMLAVASPIAIECSILTNFFLNNVWTFKKRNNQSHMLKKLLKFHIVAGLAGLVNYFIFLELVYHFGWHDIISNFIGIAVATLINYILNSIWTWKHKKEEAVE